MKKKKHYKTRLIPLPTRFPTWSSRTTTLQKGTVVPWRARIQGSYTFVSLNSRLEINKEEGGRPARLAKGMSWEGVMRMSGDAGSSSSAARENASCRVWGLGFEG